MAEAILAWRATDGFNTPAVPYFGGTAPGVWRSIPDGSMPAAFPQVATMTPFGLINPSQFRPGPPPALTSKEYAADLNEVKVLGRATGSTRSEEQTLIARFWDALMIVEELDAARALVPEDASLGETARFFALLSIAAADGLIAGFDCKYAYNFWRPYHAIVLAETDGNPATEADPDWLPLLNTPANFQEYVSAHSTISGGYFRMLMNLVGNDNPLTLTVPRLGGISRYYPEISEAMEEVNVSRIYAEFHYRSSVDLGQAVGYQTADYIFENYLIPLKHRDREAEE